MIVEKPRGGEFRFRLDRDELQLGAREFFEEIKQAIPGRCRRYDPQARIWTVSDIFLPVVLDKLAYHFPPTEPQLCEVGALSRFVVRKKRGRTAVRPYGGTRVVA